MKTLALAVAPALLLAAPALAAEFSLEGMAQARIAGGADETPWTQGGLGKTRFGGDAEIAFTDIFIEPSVRVTSELSARASVRIEPDDDFDAELLEAYARYRPVSTSRWRWSGKVGAFFPPVSLENDAIGWTGEWTVTPSAINSWVGEELRTVGAEVMLELRGERRDFAVFGSLYGWNDPTGVLLADRGWAMHDLTTGLFEEPRLPDAVLRGRGRTPPGYAKEFVEVDDRIGWYAGARWTERGLLDVTLLRYNNEADPAAFGHTVFAWRTDFWSLGARLMRGPYTVLFQGMTGDTAVAPRANVLNVTDFDSAYVLVGRDIGDFRLAGRIDVFSTQTRGVTGLMGGEDGAAATLAASWYFGDHLRVTGEALLIGSDRPARRAAGRPGESRDAQYMLNVQFSF